MSENGRRGKRSLVVNAYDRVKQDIIRCELSPGQQVSEGWLVERYGIGRSAIRIALNRLIQEQFVEVVPHQGYVITPVTLKQIRDLYDMRAIIEGAAMRAAARQADIPRLRTLASECSHLQAAVNADPGNIELMIQLLDANKQFHLTIAAATGNEFLEETMIRLLDRMERVIYLSHVMAEPERYDAEHDLHHELVDVLETGDGDAAVRLLERQVRDAKQEIITKLVASPNLDEVNLALVS